LARSTAWSKSHVIGDVRLNSPFKCEQRPVGEIFRAGKTQFEFE
jgi:hypothetical protein